MLPDIGKFWKRKCKGESYALYVQGILTLAMINAISVVGLSVITLYRLMSLGHAAFIA